MVTRSLTEAFILMRNNALQSRNFYSDTGGDDRVALVSRDPEIGLYTHRETKMPPNWVDDVEEFHYEITRIRQKMNELNSLHNKHVNRPTLDDSSDENAAIQHITQEITQMFQHCQRLVHSVSAKGRGASQQEQKINRNVISSLVSSMQELYLNFRAAQSNYFKNLKSREERSQQYFNNSLPSFSGMEENELLNEDFQIQGFNKQQLLFLEDNSLMTEQREREINQVVKSVSELHDIFTDLAHIIADQGTVLDRIDYNIEHSQIKVREGLKQLQKAETYQKKNRKLYCIVGLAVTVTILIIILLAFKLR